jgi:hypothetical protein
MGVTWTATLQTTRMNNSVAAVDAHASPATIEICTAGYAAVIVVITLSDPSFTVSGSPPNVQMAMNGAPKSGVSGLAGTNTAAVARIKEGGGGTICNNLTVASPTGGDINLNSLQITNGQTVTLTAGTITHAN